MRSLDAGELDALTRSLEGVAPDLTLVHRLRHCLAMQQNDLTTAVEALQRYFDYSHGPPPPPFRFDSRVCGLLLLLVKLQSLMWYPSAPRLLIPLSVLPYVPCQVFEPRKGMIVTMLCL